MASILIENYFEDDPYILWLENNGINGKDWWTDSTNGMAWIAIDNHELIVAFKIVFPDADMNYDE